MANNFCSARAGKKEGGWGEGIFARSRFPDATGFRISLREMYHWNFTIFGFRCSIKVDERK